MYIIVSSTLLDKLPYYLLFKAHGKHFTKKLVDRKNFFSRKILARGCNSVGEACCLHSNENSLFPRHYRVKLLNTRNLAIFTYCTIPSEHR